MLRRLMRFSMLPVLALSLVVAACESLDEQSLMGPEASAPSFTDGLLTDTVKVKYKPLKGTWISKTKVDEKVIQPAAGGNVGIAGHVLIVPPGAVSEPTLFRMEQKSSSEPGATEVYVYLTAWQKDSKGDYKIDVGANGFLLPVELRLTPEWVTDSYDPSQVRIVWAKADGGQEVYFTDRSPDGRYRAFLTHFSDYIMAIP